MAFEIYRTARLLAQRQRELDTLKRDLVAWAGICADDLPRVFEQFYRGEKSRSRATGGAGLGQAIARGIVQAHGGRIWADSQAGRGA